MTGGGRSTEVMITRDRLQGQLENDLACDDIILKPRASGEPLSTRWSIQCKSQVAFSEERANTPPTAPPSLQLNSIQVHKSSKCTLLLTAAASQRLPDATSSPD